MPTGTVAELWRWPVKSMGGERVAALRVDARGAAGDRTHALTCERRGATVPLTAREAPRLLAWSAAYDGVAADALGPDAPPLPLLTAPDGRRRRWDDASLAGALAADLEREIDLRRDPAGQQDRANTLLVTARATHAALESELGRPLDPRRFRPNLILDLDAPPWTELGWEGRRLTFAGDVELELLVPCARCVIPTRDPDTLENDPEILRHLHRAHGSLFGINARVARAGVLHAGDRVAITGR